MGIILFCYTFMQIFDKEPTKMVPLVVFMMPNYQWKYAICWLKHWIRLKNQFQLRFSFLNLFIWHLPGLTLKHFYNSTQSLPFILCILQQLENTKTLVALWGIATIMLKKVWAQMRTHFIFMYHLHIIYLQLMCEYCLGSHLCS